MNVFLVLFHIIDKIHTKRHACKPRAYRSIRWYSEITKRCPLSPKPRSNYDQDDCLIGTAHSQTKEIKLISLKILSDLFFSAL